jgi:hypothetical protein
MLGLEDFMTIQALVKHGVCLCDLAEQLGMHPKTLSRAVKRGGPPALRRGRRGSLLDPYRPVIDGLLAEGVWMSDASLWYGKATAAGRQTGDRLTAHPRCGPEERLTRPDPRPANLRETVAFS